MKRAATLLAIGVVSLALVWRRPDVVVNPQFWAEDGLVFFMQASEQGINSLWLPYAGYFHGGARAVAWAASYLPVQYAPHAYALASWLLLVLLVLYIFSTRLSLRTHEKFIVSLALVCTTTSNEVFFNLANWATLTALWLIVLSVIEEPRHSRDAVIDGVVLVAAGVSTPFSICLWVLFLLRWWVRRTVHSGALLAISLGVAALQVSNMGARIAEAPSNSLVDRIHVLAFPFGYIFFGDAVYYLDLDIAVRVVILAGIAAFYGISLWRAWSTGARAALMFLVASGLAAGVSLFVTRMWDVEDVRLHAGRHQYLPAVTLIWALASLRTAPVQWLPVGAAFAAFVFLNPSTKGETLPDLHWRENVVRCLEQPDPCRITINPVTPPPQAWTVTLAGTR